MDQSSDSLIDNLELDSSIELNNFNEQELIEQLELT
jgi:hypothetical protein